MATFAVVFDVPDEYMVGLDKVNTAKSLFELAAKGWVECHTPIRYSPRLSSEEILSCIVEENAKSGDHRLLEWIFEHVKICNILIDTYMATAVSPHAMVELNKINWIGNSCVIQLDRL